MGTLVDVGDGWYGMVYVACLICEVQPGLDSMVQFGALVGSTLIDEQVAQAHGLVELIMLKVVGIEN